MKFFFSEHFLIQAKARRKISKKLAKTIYLQATEKFSDTYSGHNVAIAKVNHAGETRKIEIWIITAYPLKDSEIKNRVVRGRWKVIDEKN